METAICPNTPKCPIFNGILEGTQYTSTYKRLYCEAGKAGREKCMRYKVATAVGKCPPKVLPNSTKSMEEIISDMRAAGEI
ncbi:MAG TPA: hypothetical protein DDX98_05985 [Bacteroidales bacterium]|jgi:hypothetical protein|nr:hypothetical protein [Bacteroidales bacterium]